MANLYEKIDEKLNLRKKIYNDKLWSVIDGALTGTCTYFAYNDFANGRYGWGTIIAGVGIIGVLNLYNDIKGIIKNHRNKKSELEKTLQDLNEGFKETDEE